MYNSEKPCVSTVQNATNALTEQILLIVPNPLIETLNLHVYRGFRCMNLLSEIGSGYILLTMAISIRVVRMPVGNCPKLLVSTNCAWLKGEFSVP
jgi:hypothetical protein